MIDMWRMQIKSLTVILFLIVSLQELIGEKNKSAILELISLLEEFIKENYHVAVYVMIIMWGIFFLSLLCTRSKSSLQHDDELTGIIIECEPGIPAPYCRPKYIASKKKEDSICRCDSLQEIIVMPEKTNSVKSQGKITHDFDDNRVKGETSCETNKAVYKEVKEDVQGKVVTGKLEKEQDVFAGGNKKELDDKGNCVDKDHPVIINSAERTCKDERIDLSMEKDGFKGENNPIDKAENTPQTEPLTCLKITEENLSTKYKSDNTTCVQDVFVEEAKEKDRQLDVKGNSADKAHLIMTNPDEKTCKVSNTEKNDKSMEKDGFRGVNVVTDKSKKTPVNKIDILDEEVEKYKIHEEGCEELLIRRTRDILQTLGSLEMDYKKIESKVKEGVENICINLQKCELLRKQFQDMVIIRKGEEMVNQFNLKENTERPALTELVTTAKYTTVEENRQITVRRRKTRFDDMTAFWSDDRVEEEMSTMDKITDFVLPGCRQQ